MGRWHRWCWIVLGVCLGVLGGCREDVWEAAKPYFSRMKALRTEHESFARAQKAVKQIKNLHALQKHLRHRVLPALSRYLRSLKAVKPGHRSLRDIHTLRVRAHESWKQGLRDFLQTTRDASKHLTAAMALEKQARIFTSLEKQAADAVQALTRSMRQ